jgi:hypothetical protein
VTIHLPSSHYFHARNQQKISMYFRTFIQCNFYFVISKIQKALIKSFGTFQILEFFKKYFSFFYVLMFCAYDNEQNLHK